jgi:hypothetical protein
MKCQNCSREVNIEWNVCPYCGAKIVKPSKEELIAIRDRVVGRMQSQVDRSPEGLAAALRYVDASTTLVTQFLKVFERFLDRHNKMRANPRELSNPQWLMDMSGLLPTLQAASVGRFDKKNPVDKDLLPMPDGCFSVHFHLMKIQQYTDSLVKNYDQFIQRRNQRDLQAAGKAVEQLNNSIQEVLNEIDKLTQAITSGA